MAIVSIYVIILFKGIIMLDWVIRFFKGTLIGTGFILPGVSGGALAAIFGLYERIIIFIAHIHKNFLKNVLFFLPVAIGGLFGMFLLARPLSFLLEYYEVYVIWGFIGCIVGVFPSLWAQAGRKGRKSGDYWVLAISTVFGLVILFLAESYFQTEIQLNILTWFLAGMLIALGTLLPGMSPSNFLVYLGMYKPMVNGFKALDIMVLLPIFAGAITCLLAFSKIVDILLEKRYSTVFHFIVGIVIASTIMIIPRNFNYLLPQSLFCLLTFAFGVGLGFWMSKLEEKYKRV